MAKKINVNFLIFNVFPAQFQQIVKILNAHTDSLGWIDRETALLRQKVDDVSKVSEYRKREQERSFRLVSYDDMIPLFFDLL